MPFKIPAKEFSYYTAKVVFEGTPYKLVFRWNSYGEFWTLSFYALGGEVVLQNIKLVLNYELISRFGHLEIPPGELRAIDTTGELTSIGRNDLFDGIVILQYTRSTE